MTAACGTPRWLPQSFVAALTRAVQGTWTLADLALPPGSFAQETEFVAGWLQRGVTDSAFSFPLQDVLRAVLLVSGPACACMGCK